MKVADHEVVSDFEPKCPSCFSYENVTCVDCGEHWEFCECGDVGAFRMTCWKDGTFFWWTAPEIGDEEDSSDVAVTCRCEPPASFTCGYCRVIRNSKDEPWRPMDSWWYSDYDDHWGLGYSHWDRPYCRHAEATVEFPNGAVVLASSKFDRRPDEEPPDYGLYLDWTWKTSGRAEYIDWPDFDYPSKPKLAVDAIVDAFTKALTGYKVEVGCIGGHGRTGTVLACMAILAGVDEDEAVSWVRQNYCKQAVESHYQTWFIEFFAATIAGTTPPKQPEPAWSSKTTEPKAVAKGSATTSSLVQKAAIQSATKNGHSLTCTCATCVPGAPEDAREEPADASEHPATCVCIGCLDEVEAAYENSHPPRVSQRAGNWIWDGPQGWVDTRVDPSEERYADDSF